MANAVKTPKRKTKAKAGSRAKPATGVGVVRRAGYIVLRTVAAISLLVLALVVLFRFVNPPTTVTIWSEARRLGGVERDWVALENVAPVMARSVVAAEDADFCLHWGFDVNAIRAAIDAGGTRGASTLTQQVVKNVFLWQGRSWIRKALETAITPVVEVIWPKRRIIEVYLNIAEMGEGVFGVAAAAKQYFGTTPDKLTPRQAALLAAVLPSPKLRSPKKPSAFVTRRANAILDGAATIRADGRSACFED
jgi:monofunctional biosynthetic peptidoglycan transglycosylase